MKRHARSVFLRAEGKYDSGTDDENFTQASPQIISRRLLELRKTDLKARKRRGRRRGNADFRFDFDSIGAIARSRG
jgi:hypothetical protein